MLELIANSDKSLADVQAAIEQLYSEHHYLIVSIHTGKQRSGKQNSALHVYCRELAKALNAAGWDMRRTMKQEIDIPWTEHSVKENLWRPMQEVMTGKESTKDPERKEYPEIYEALSRHMGQKTGVYVPWPTQEASS